VVGKKDQIKVYVCQVGCGGVNWMFFDARKKRNFDTVYLNKDDMLKLRKTIDHFVSSEEMYARLGIPYKLNLLFSGMAGMGKTSLAMAIASILNRNVYIFPISKDVDDIKLIQAISGMASDSILLCEDIDCVFEDRVTTDAGKNKVTLSGILNILDGLTTRIGLITILTTNFIDRIDKALKRAGRIDLHLHFEYATNEQITQMIEMYYPSKIDLAKAFIECLIKMDMKVTMAELQSFFFYTVGIDGDPVMMIDKLKI